MNLYIVRRPPRSCGVAVGGGENRQYESSSLLTALLDLADSVTSRRDGLESSIPRRVLDRTLRSVEFR